MTSAPAVCRSYFLSCASAAGGTLMINKPAACTNFESVFSKWQSSVKCKYIKFLAEYLTTGGTFNFIVGRVYV